MENKIKKFIECHIPVTSCNLRCHYCYITQKGLWKNKKVEFKYPIERIRKALSCKRLGGVCLLNLCGGGETLIPHETVEIAKAFLEEGHYVSIVTNGTISKHIDEILQFPSELLSRLFFKFSFQYLELKRTNQMQKFFENIKNCKNKGCAFTVEITPNDELIPYIDEIKEVSLKELGALPHITIARVDTDPKKPILTTKSKSEYKAIWETFDSDMFKFKLPLYDIKIKDFCYAGDWSFCVNLGTGIMSQCYKSKIHKNIFEDIEKPIEFCAIGNNCREPHCYNAHSFLLLGNIPNKYQECTYAKIRNRICLDGSEWLTPNVKEFFSSKFQESNHEYGKTQKLIHNIKTLLRL